MGGCLGDGLLSHIIWGDCSVLFCHVSGVATSHTLCPHPPWLQEYCHEWEPGWGSGENRGWGEGQPLPFLSRLFNWLNGWYLWLGILLLSVGFVYLFIALAGWLGLPAFFFCCSAVGKPRSVVCHVSTLISCQGLLPPHTAQTQVRGMTDLFLQASSGSAAR